MKFESFFGENTRNKRLIVEKHSLLYIDRGSGAGMLGFSMVCCSVLSDRKQHNNKINSHNFCWQYKIGENEFLIIHINFSYDLLLYIDWLQGVCGYRPLFNYMHRYIYIHLHIYVCIYILYISIFFYHVLIF